MEELDLVRQTTTPAVAYSFRFKWGWAIFTLNEATGEMAIQSDWGSYCYRWHIDALGTRDGRSVRLTEFLAGCDGDYVTRKLKLGSQAKCLDKVFDEVATLRDVRERIRDERRIREISKDEARAYWDMAKRWVDEDRCEPDTCPDRLERFLGNESYEFIQQKDSARFVFMSERLWPFFTRWLNDNVVNKRAPASEATHA